MPVPDHGGSALVIEVSEGTALGLAAAAAPAIPDRAINQGGLVGTARLRVAVSSVDFLPTERLAVTFDLAGSAVDVDSLSNFPATIPGSFRTVALGGTVSVTDTIDVVLSRRVQIDFTPSGPFPMLAVQLDEPLLLSSPLVQLILANAFLTGGEAGYWATRSQLVATVTTLLRTQVAIALLGLAPIPLFTAPVSIPLGAGLPSVPVTVLALKTFARSLKIIIDLGGPPGTPAAVVRSQLLTTTASGVPVDAMAFVLSNAGLLRDILRPAAIAAIGLPAAGFAPGPPFFFRGPPFPLAVPGVPLAITLDSMMLGVDEASRLIVTANLTAVIPTGALTVRATITQAFTFTASVVPGTLTIVAASGAPAVSSDVEIAWWVYVGGALSGGFTVVALLALADAFLGTLALNGALSTLIAGFIPATIPVALPIPPGLPALAVRIVSFNQVDATRGLIPFGPFLIPSPFRDHDLVVNLV